MARPARPHIMKSVTIALLFTMSTYTYLSFISISYFGKDNIEPSIFNNIKQEGGVPSILLRCLFLLIFFCNIPFVFFAGKVALMAVVHQCCCSKKKEEREIPADDEDDEYFRENNTAINANNEVDDVTNTGPSSPQKVTQEAQQAQTYETFSVSYMSMSVKGEIKPEDELSFMSYLTVCFSYLVSVALAAIFIDDLTLIFGIIAGLAECSTVFILPSVFYLIACYSERKAHREYEEKRGAGLSAKRPPSKKGGGVFVHVCVYFYMLMGVSYFAISNYFNFAKILR